jgi:hypothetical protein
MSTICKVDPRVRSRRSIRRAVRNRIAALAESFRLTGQMQGFFAYSALLAMLERTTDHKKFLALVVRAGQQEAINELS